MLSKNTRPEMRLQEALILRGEVFETHVKGIAGTPDIFLPESQMVVFVHGCYWHSHKSCKLHSKHSAKNPLINLMRNAAVMRDVSIVRELRGSGFKVFVAWECHINTEVGRVVDKILRLKSK